MGGQDGGWGMEILKTEKRFGNTVLQSFARNGIEDFDFAILSMSSRVVNVSPLLKLTLSILRMKNLSLYGVQKFFNFRILKIPSFLIMKF